MSTKMQILMVLLIITRQAQKPRGWVEHALHVVIWCRQLLAVCPDADAAAWQGQWERTYYGMHGGKILSASGRAPTGASAKRRMGTKRERKKKKVEQSCCAHPSGSVRRPIRWLLTPKRHASDSMNKNLAFGQTPLSSKGFLHAGLTYRSPRKTIPALDYSLMAMK